MRQFLKDLAEQLRPHYLRLVRSSLRRAPRRSRTEWLEDRTLLAASLVRDINTVPGNVASSPAGLTDINGILYFRAYTDDDGIELWKSDGTTTGTVMVRDIWIGSGGAYPRDLTNVNGTLYFCGSDGTNGDELWKSDGTEPGTVMVRDIRASYGSSPKFLTNVNGTLYFRANDGTNGEELWKSDGTTAGTVMVRDIRVGSGSSTPRYLTNVNGTLYFVALNDTGNDTLRWELWKSDGTTAGTVLVRSIRGPNPYLTNVNGTLYFRSSDGANGEELWKSDGTMAGTVMVRDIRSGSGSSSPRYLINVNGTLYFRANDGTNGEELWKSDGTTAGTVLVRDIRVMDGSSPESLTNVNGTLYFRANDGANGTELWKSDGTASGTVMVRDIRASGGSSPNFLTNVNGTLYFVADNGTSGVELWKSNGTTAGTEMVRDIWGGSGSSSPTYLTNVSGRLYFVANDGTNGTEPWKSDGTAPGTVMVRDIRVMDGSNPEFLTNVNGTLYFRANDGTNGDELWKSDGTTAGTVMVRDIRIGSDGSTLLDLTNVNGTLYFRANNGINGVELWKSDGTTAGTVMVRDIRIGSGGSRPERFTNVNGTLYFIANDGTNGYEIWKSDGTTAGTVMVRDIRSGSNGLRLVDRMITSANGTLYFVANDGPNGYELWRSDGTTTGTVMVRDIWIGSGSSSPWDLTNVNGTLYFEATDGINGRELWKSDGTTAGTVMVRDIRSGSGGSVSAYLTNVNGTLYFLSNDGTSGYELWKSDGTTAGTVMVRDIWSGSGGSVPRFLTNVNGMLYFRASDGTNGDELWKSDGTSAGTAMVSDIRIGSLTSNPKYLTNVNGALYFVANDGANGYELWKSDGTTAGTLMVGDIRSGSDSSYPEQLTNVNGTLYFRAEDGTTGTELWRWGNNEAPTDIRLSNRFIAENAGVNATVGTLSTIDPDADDSFTYTLVSGTGGSDNAAFNISGNQLRATAGLDFEAKSNYTVRVRSTDQGGLWTEKVFTITVTDVAEGFAVNGTSGVDTILASYSGDGINHTWIIKLNAAAPFNATGPLVVNGLGGNDTLQISGRSVSDLFELAANQVSVNGVAVQFNNIENIRILGGDGSDQLTVTANAPPGVSRSFDGGLGSDAVKALAGANTWNVTGAGIANLISTTNLALTTIESLTGGTGDDQFVYAATGNLTGSVLGGTGNDTLNFAAKTTAQTVNLQLNTATSTGGIGGIESFIGSSSATVTDILVGANSSTNWTIDGANSGSLTILPAAAFSFSGFESLTGGTATDTFTFTNTGSLSKTLTGGTSTGVIDTLNLSAKTAALNFQLNTTSSVAGTIGTHTGIELITGNSVAGSTVKRFNNTTTAWLVNTLGQIVVGGVTYRSVGAIAGGPGIDTITGPAVASPGVTAWTVDAANGGFLVIPGSTVPFSNVENLTGSTGTDTFLFGASGSLSGTLNGGTSIGVIDTLNLSAKPAALNFQLNTTSSIAGIIGTYTGIEQITGNSVPGSTVTRVNNTTTAWVVNSSGQIVVGGVTYSGVGAIAGGPGIDMITGPAIASPGVTAWTIDAANGGSLVIPGATVPFSSIENLTGSTGTDTFLFGASGGLSGKLNGGTSTGVIDTLNLAAKSGPLNFQLNTTSGVAGTIGTYTGIEQITGNSVPGSTVTRVNNTTTAWVVNASGQIVVGGVTYSGVGAIAGGPGTDTITGPAIAGPGISTWTINTANGGTLAIPGATIGFTAVENLTGGTGADAFDILPGGSLSGNLNGGTGTEVNSLSYANWTAGVTVNLAVTTPANATAVTGLVSSIQMVTGGARNDVLTGRAALSTILIGLAGNDQLTGGSQRDLLFGGTGADTLNAASGDDLLISGATLFDIERARLLEIHAEWLSARTFAQRTANIWGNGTGTRSNGNTFLNNDSADAIANTVLSDADLDILTGAFGQDWFFALAAETADFLGTGLTPDRRN
jgi:ELWxxDGT repeat protein